MNDYLTMEKRALDRAKQERDIAADPNAAIVEASRRIEELERRIRELEERPPIVIEREREVYPDPIPWRQTTPMWIAPNPLLPWTTTTGGCRIQ